MSFTDHYYQLGYKSQLEKMANSPEILQRVKDRIAEAHKAKDVDANWGAEKRLALLGGVGALSTGVGLWDLLNNDGIVTVGAPLAATIGPGLLGFSAYNYIKNKKDNARINKNPDSKQFAEKAKAIASWP